MRLIRLFTILYVVFRYGLDDFIFTAKQHSIAKKCINLLLFWRDLSQSRGERLRLALESLGPIFVKFGQVLSTRRDLIPLDIADELAKLQDRVPPFAYSEVERVIEQAFECPLQAVFDEFDPVAIASASVAQVHFARLKDGHPVAVKVLRPGIAKVIANDLDLLDVAAWLTKTVSSEGRRLKPREVVAEFARHLKSELDLTLEAANCSLLKRNFAKSHQLLVPEVYWDYCREQVMVMERMDGIPVSQIARLQSYGIDVPTLARDGVEIFFTQVFRDGFFHADMHPGNIQVAYQGADKGRYIALDFGIMGTLNENDKYYLARNFLAFFKRDYRDVAVAHIESGWVPPETNVDELENAVRSICEPIFNKPLSEISFGRTLMSLFQMSRRFGVVIQPQLVMLQKTLLNIEGLGRQLDPELDLWATAKPFLERWMSEQFGWRRLLKTVKQEWPHWGQQFPELPRRVYQFLQRPDASIQQKQLSQLIQTQEQQARQQRWISWLLAVLVITQCVSLAYLWIAHT